MTNPGRAGLIEISSERGYRACALVTSECNFILYNVVCFDTAILIEALEAAPGDRPFVTFWVNEDEQETLTFAEFRRRARAQARALRAHGLSSGERVVVIMPQGIAAMTVFTGAMMLGGVPAFIAYPNDRVEASKYRAGLTGVTANLKAKLVVIDDEFPEDMLAHVSIEGEATLLRAGSGDEAEQSPDRAMPSISADSVAFIQHSAGTTGLQKGVALTHAAVLRQLEHLVRVLRIESATDRIYSWLPLYHDMGLIACFMLPMAYHLPLVMQSPLDWVMVPETMLEVISEHKCTLAWLPNFAFQFVPRRTRPERRARYDLSALRALINCSEPVRTGSMREFETAFAANGLKPGVFQSSYAMAENVFAATQSEIDCPSGPTRVYADGKEFRGSHKIVVVTEGTRRERFVSRRQGDCCPTTRCASLRIPARRWQKVAWEKFLSRATACSRAITIVRTLLLRRSLMAGTTRAISDSFCTTSFMWSGERKT